MSELMDMMNIGKEMEKKLKAVGIDSSEKLIQAGSKQAFLQLKQEYPNVCLVHLYTFEISGFDNFIQNGMQRRGCTWKFAT